MHGVSIFVREVHSTKEDDIARGLDHSGGQIQHQVRFFRMFFRVSNEHADNSAIIQLGRHARSCFHSTGFTKVTQITRPVGQHAREVLNTRLDNAFEFDWLQVFKVSNE